MKRRKHAIIIFIGTLVVLVCAVLAYRTYILPTYRNYKQQEYHLNLEEDRSLSFGKLKQQQHIFSIEMELSGFSSRNFELWIGSDTEPKHRATIKGGNVRYDYMNDWYSDSCHIFIKGPDALKGNLHFHVRFMSMD